MTRPKVDLLIIGGSGLLGSVLIKFFNDAYITYNSTPIENKNAIRLDISDSESLKFLLAKLEPKNIIVTSALTDVDKCEKFPELAYKINRDPFVILTNYLRNHSGRLIQISTDYVFSGERGNYKEEDGRNPINVYGKSKKEAEDIIINSKANYSIIRTSGTFGINASTGKKNFFTWMYDNLRNGIEVKLLQDQIYSPVLNLILAKAIYEIYEGEIPGIIHFSSADSISRLEFGLLVAEKFNLDKGLIKPAAMNQMNWVAKRPKNSSLNNEKALRILNSKPVRVSEELNILKNSLSNGDQASGK